MTAYVAVDLGRARVGVAAGDDDSGVVTPLAVLDGRDRRALIDALERLAAERDAEFVVGLPLRLDGSAQRLTRDARAFAATLQRATGRAVHLQDETLSTVEAAHLSRDAGRRARTPVDDLAAQVLLQSFLAARAQATSKKA